MRRLNRIPGGPGGLLLIALLAGGGALRAQPAGPATATAPATAPAATPAEQVDPQLKDRWENFLHYVRIFRLDAAESFGKAILESKPEARQVYRLTTQPGSEDAMEVLRRARANERLQPIVDQVRVLIDQGALEVRKDPAEIRRWIQMLGGTPRQYLYAMRRLIECGEYAVPQMIQTFADTKTTPLLRERLTEVLPRLGKDAVRPLLAALDSDATEVQELAARSLGKIGYPHAAAGLRELMGRKGVLETVVSATRGALVSCAGPQAPEKPPAELFYQLAEKYYRRDESINPDARYDTANVWYWQQDLGVTYRPVPRAIFNDLYAARAAQKALQHDPTFYPAVVLWLAANTRWQVNLPAGATNPFHPADAPKADHYLRSAGARYLQLLLHRTLKDGDVGVALRAIRALRETVGAENLVRQVDELGGAQPLVEALTYAVREIRYEAAESLALARPQKRFTGDQLVPGALCEALRQTGTAVAVLVDGEQARRNKAKDLLRAEGYEVFDAATLGPALAEARKTGGVDLLVLASDIRSPELGEALRQIRSGAVLSLLPVVILARAGDVVIVRGIAERDRAAAVVPEDKLDAATLKKAIADAQARAPGGKPLPPDQATLWAVRAAGCLKLLATTRNPVYDLTEATRALIAALKDKRPEVQIAAAEALGQIRDASAQQALAALAGDAKASKEVRLATYAALAESVRQFGNQLTEAQADAIITVVLAKGDLEIRRAAAQVLGALDLPSQKIKQLILSAP